MCGNQREILRAKKWCHTFRIQLFLKCLKDYEKDKKYFLCTTWSNTQHHVVHCPLSGAAGVKHIYSVSEAVTIWAPIQYKMSSYQYRKSHCGDKTLVRSSYLHNGISYTGKMASLYWFSPLKSYVCIHLYTILIIFRKVLRPMPVYIYIYMLITGPVVNMCVKKYNIQRIGYHFSHTRVVMVTSHNVLCNLL